MDEATLLNHQRLYHVKISVMVLESLDEEDGDRAIKILSESSQLGLWNVQETTLFLGSLNYLDFIIDPFFGLHDGEGVRPKEVDDLKKRLKSNEG